MKKKKIQIELPVLIVNDFKAYAREERGMSYIKLLKKWIQDFVDIRNEKDLKYLKEKKEKIDRPE